ncbi:MAG TPA: LPS assembly lipoprotein LptE, partial [Burkholderiales bacterium]|nr:LPS assembly lipoprotein LptE [Burkholderiales bacterium]
FILHPSSFLLLAAALLLSGCGFHLRGAATLPFDSLYVQAPPSSLFGAQLRRVLSASSNARIVDKAADAEATLILLDERREKEILSLSGTGRVREYQIRYRVRYQVISKDKRELVPSTEIVLRRDFSFNDEAALSKESEEALLYRDMQTDAVQQLVRRLQATKVAASG